MLTIENDELKKIECMFNHVMNFIICRRCDLAIPAEHIRAHVRRKHRIGCSEELVNSIIAIHRPRSADMMKQFKNDTAELDLPVDGIPLKNYNGFRTGSGSGSYHVIM